MNYCSATTLRDVFYRPQNKAVTLMLTQNCLSKDQRDFAGAGYEGVHYYKVVDALDG